VLSERLSRRGRIDGEELVETLSRVFGGMLDAALELQKALRKAREIPISVGPLRLSMSVGLHSDRIYFFLVGSMHRELVLAGPAASVAVAMESAANAGEIGVSPETAALLPASAVRLREDGLRLLKWRKAPMPPAGASPDRAAGEEILRGMFPRALGK
jgi:class 3 adenylate cyclase